MVRAVDIKYKPTGPLAGMIGSKARTRGQIVKALWKFIKKEGLQGESGPNPPGYSQGGEGGAGGDYTIFGTAQGIGGGGAGGSYSKTGINPPAYNFGGGIQDSRAWPTPMAIYPYPGPIGIPERFHGLDGTGGGGTGGCSSPGYVSGAPSVIIASGRGGCGLVQIRYPV